jgi:hypothetical protein
LTVAHLFLVFCIVCCTLFVLCLVYPMLSAPLDCVLYFVRSVSCVPNVVSSSWLCVVLCSSCVLCTQCCQFLWIVHSWLPLRFSLERLFSYILDVLDIINSLISSTMIIHGSSRYKNTKTIVSNLVVWY